MTVTPHLCPKEPRAGGHHVLHMTRILLNLKFEMAMGLGCAGSYGFGRLFDCLQMKSLGKTGGRPRQNPALFDAALPPTGASSLTNLRDSQNRLFP